MVDPWTIRFARRVNEDKYKIPRGEVAQFAEAVSILRRGPGIPDHQLVPNTPNVYQYVRNGYLNAYEVLEAERAIRIVYFEIPD